MFFGILLVLSYKFADKFQFPPDAGVTRSTAILAVYMGRMPMLRIRPTLRVAMKYATEFATQDTSHAPARAKKKAVPMKSGRPLLKFSFSLES